MKKVCIIGAGQHGRVVENILTQSKEFKVVGFLDDNAKSKEIIGKIDSFCELDLKKVYFFIAIGDNNVRMSIFENIKNAGAKFVNAIHKKSFIEKSVELGINVMVGAFSYININSTVRDNTIINNGCIVEHDCVIGKNCHLTPGVIAAGEVSIEDNVFIGIGSTLRDRIRISKECVIGAQSNVVSNIDKVGVYFGSPARFIKSISKK